MKVGGTHHRTVSFFSSSPNWDPTPHPQEIVSPPFGSGWVRGGDTLEDVFNEETDAEVL
jgi:hypothetical protein